MLLYGHGGRCWQPQQKSEVVFIYIIRFDASLCCVRPCLKEKKKIAADKTFKVSIMKTLERIIRIRIREKGKLASRHDLRLAPLLTSFPPPSCFLLPVLPVFCPSSNPLAPFLFPPCCQSKAPLDSSCCRQSAKALRNQRQSKSFSYMIPVRAELSQEEASLCVTWHIQFSVLPEGLELVLGLGQRVDFSAKSLPCTGSL